MVKLAIINIPLSVLFILMCIGIVHDHYRQNDNHTISASCKAAIVNDGFIPRSYEENAAYKERVNRACY